MDELLFYEIRAEELQEREFRAESQTPKSLLKSVRIKRRPRNSDYNFNGANRRRVRKMQ